MKKRVLLIIVCLVIAIILPAMLFGFVETPSKFCFASEEEIPIIIKCGDKEWKLCQSDLIRENTGIKSQYISNEGIGGLLKKLKRMGFDDKEALTYIFDNLEYLLEMVAGEVEQAPINSKVIIEDDRAYATKETAGQKIDKEQLYSEICEQLLNNPGCNACCTLAFDGVMPDITKQDNDKLTYKKSSFSTPIYGNNQEGRIHNIGLALSKFNNKVISAGEYVSFNSVIGMTTEKNGYSKAKVILNGEYVDDYGGGVCQAATTLYNAVLLAGLKIVEANPHSLKVGYVDGSFDAMVSNGLSDFVFANNTGMPIIISTYCDTGRCGASIFGLENIYEIKRRTEDVSFDCDELPEVNCKTVGILEYYLDGELLKEEKIRSDTYYKPKTSNAVSTT